MLFGIYSLVSAGFFLALGAPDVALTEAAIGAGITPILMLGTLRITAHTEKRSARRSLLPLLVVCITGAALVHGTFDMPYFSDPEGFAHHHVAPHYILHAQEETGVPNIVTAVLASYRGFDTLGEVVVIFTAGIGVLALLGMVGSGNQLPSSANMRHHLVLRVISKSLMPLILIFGLYIQFHGDFGPGGGFQAGVVFTAAFVLYTMIYGLEPVCKAITPRLLIILMSLGVLLYGGTGLEAMILGENFLSYNALSHDPVHGQHLGILLVEFGVGITVSAVMLSIFYSIAGFQSDQKGKSKA